MPIAHIVERDVLDVLQQLVRIPSVNPSLAPDEGHGEKAIAAFATEWLNARGVRAWIEETEPGRPNAVAQVGKSEPTLVLCAHLDTVGTVGMQSPFEPRLENRRVYGRGTYDMKGSAAAIMAAAVALERTGFAGRVLVALVADEEYASLGAIDFVRRRGAHGCIVTEPADGRLIIGHKGFVWARITTTGRAAHGSRWDLGVSAIGRMGRIIAARPRRTRGDRGRDRPLR
jgi:acetylornithine deacetylase